VRGPSRFLSIICATRPRHLRIICFAQTRGGAPSPAALRATTSPRAAGRGEQAASFSRRGFSRPSPGKPLHETFRLKKTGGGAPKGAGVDTAGPPTSVATYLRSSRRAPLLETRSPSGALPRLSPKPRGFSSVRSRASWQRTTDPLPGQPAPGRPASWPAGRVSAPPADEVTSPIPGTAPAPSISRHRLTSLKMSETSFLVRRTVRIQDISTRRAMPLIHMRIFFAFCSMCRRENCGNAAMIRTFQLRS
jgi:hypothetical protein